MDGISLFRSTVPNLEAMNPIAINDGVHTEYDAFILPEAKIAGSVAISTHFITAKDIPNNSVVVGVSVYRPQAHTSKS